MLSSHLKSLALSTISDSVYSYLINTNNFRKRIIITSYHWPDLDGIASAYALSRLLQKKGYRNVESMIWQEPQDEAKWVMKKLDFSIPQISIKGNEEFILVDVSNLDIPSFIPTDRVSAVIDHRNYYNARAFSNAVFWIKPVGSAASLITSLYILFNITPEKTSANLLYSAIMSNTITCKTHNTTDLDKGAVEWLENFVDLEKDFIEEMFIAKSNIPDIKKRIDDDLSSVLQTINGKNTAVAQLEIVGVENFLNDNKDAVMNALALIKKERNAESLFLVAVDIKSFSTFFCFLEEATEKFVGDLISLNNFCNYFYKVNDIFTRKEIISILQ